MPSRWTWWSFLATALTLAWIMAAPGTALANAGGYATHVWSGCGGGFNSGSWDDAGNVYVPCGSPSTIGVYDPAGRLVRSIPVDGYVSDVAPTRDGRYLYLAGSGAPRRLERQADGSYAPDAAWSAERYPIWGTTYAPGGYFVATDAAGNVYYADGTWAANLTHTVVKYAPSGAFVTRFGEWANTWELGTFYWALGGLAVSADGATVYTVELGNNRVQRWTRQASGAYEVQDSFGSTAANNPDRAGYCDYAGWRGTFAAPYDVALDRDDNLYVINTTCKQVLSFAPDFGALRANLDVRVDGGDYPRPHGFAVGADGTVFVGENQRVLRPAGGAAPDGPPVRDVVPAPVAPEPVAPEPEPVAPAPEPAAPRVMPDPRMERPPSATARDTRLGRLVRTRRGVALRAVCRVRCRVELAVSIRGRRVARRVTWLAPGAGHTVQAPVAGRVLRTRAGRTLPLRAVITVRDAAGNRAAWRRTA